MINVDNYFNNMFFKENITLVLCGYCLKKKININKMIIVKYILKKSINIIIQPDDILFFLKNC